MSLRKVPCIILIAAIAMTLVGFDGCNGADNGTAEGAIDIANAGINEEKIDMEGVANVSENAFTKYYHPVRVTVDPNVPAYDLPVDLATATNYKEFTQAFDTQPAQLALLRQNGFVTTDFRERFDEVAGTYKYLKDSDVPVFITTDSLLHLYHVQFGKTLKDIEQNRFYPDLITLTDLMQKASQDQYDTLSGALHDAARQNWAYFTVARVLLEPDFTIPEPIKADVAAELRLIDAHSGQVPSPIFTYIENYSQYVPRGHYTRSEELKRYFKAMMWYGRIGMLIVGKDLNPDAVISQEEADRQTMQAALIAGLLNSTSDEMAVASEIWNKIYQVTAFYVGIADDLTPADYSAALNQVLGASWSWQALAEEGTLDKLREQLATFGSPRIYGGLGAVTMQPPFTPDQLKEALAITAGLRFMGQRYVPDSYMAQKVLTPSVGAYQGAGKPFTMARTPMGDIRGFPRGLDILNAMGSERAAEILAAEGDTEYPDYDLRMGELRAQFAAMGENAWNQNLYWSWLHALDATIRPVSGDGWPTFMTTQAWQDKNLNTALASWAQLRHDTILYAKQTSTLEAAAMPPQAEPVVGYVEPVPEFYARLLTLTNMTRDGLNALVVLDEAGDRRLKSLASILQRLLDISQQELANQELSDKDYQFIANFGEELEWVVAGVEEEGLETTIIADVHTEANTQQVLEEGTGYLRVMFVAYKHPRGHLLLGAGPVLSHYEFKQPMANRLTDEAWKDMLMSERPPADAPWVSSFYAPR